MRWLSAVLTFVNLSVVSGLVLGMVGRGLNMLSAAVALVCGAAFAVAAFLGTSDPRVVEKAANDRRSERKPRKGSPAEGASNGRILAAMRRYRHVWFWAMAVFFAMFAVRSFCWLFYIDGSDYKIQSPNNLGDLSLHLTLIKTFANGAPLWPDNPIYVFSKLRYPAGIDLFNALLLLVHVDLITGLVWVGLVASLATFYGFYRWHGGGYRPQTDRMEKHPSVHVRDATRLALRNPGRRRHALVLARKILSPKSCSRGRRPRLPASG